MIDALFATTKQRVFALLFGQPDRTFFANELIELTRSGSGAVQRELRRLVDGGLVTVTHVGNQKHFQANRDAPIFTELRSIVLKTVGLADPIKAALASLAPHIQAALIYGSVAKGTATAASDVDLLLVSNDLTLEQAYRTLAPVERELARRISVTLYTPTEFAKRREAGNSFITKVMAGEHILLMGTEHEFAAAG